MAELRIAHTGELDADTRAAIRRLLDGAFAGFGDDAFENALGGMHVLVTDGGKGEQGGKGGQGGELIGHASLVARRLLHRGRALRTGYVEGVAVRADRRRRGHGDAMMSVLERLVREGYQLGALGASPDGARLYTARGWHRWQGRSSVLSPAGIRHTPRSDGHIYVLPVTGRLDLSGELTCDWRHGSPW